MSVFKCHFCAVCDGTGCIAEFPGMGGVKNNALFQNNCAAWKDGSLLVRARELAEKINRTSTCAVRLGPVTGAVENIGWRDEVSFYHELISAAFCAGINVTAGDGCPDIKLQSGIAALNALPARGETARPAVFIKPYDNARIFERVEWSLPAARVIGVDIDSYDIVTMRNLVSLEKKTAPQLREIKARCPVPFAIKGVILDQDLDLAREVKPDIVVVSNHGGRVDRGSAESSLGFLVRNFDALRNSCGELWIDGGIRTRADVETAQALGVREVMCARPFISALCKGGADAVKKAALEFASHGVVSCRSNSELKAPNSDKTLGNR
ncbi:MAG: alpha-hydroxy-acid oxidizing protein [Treponemataceae bacterium]|nr:MAG: alpha-hydroxy-acid oxidizing protein [Treponemataceae bacterium]